MIEFENNNFGEANVQVDVKVQSDEGIFLNLLLDDGDTADLFIDTNEGIQEFFDKIDEVKAEYERLKDSKF